MTAFSLLSAAAHRGDLREVRRYVQHEPCLVDAVEKGGSRWTPLMHASRGGHVSVATYILDHGARVDFRDREGDTALHVAASHDHRKLVEVLLDRGADPTIPGRNQSAPLSRAAGSEIVRLLLVHGKCDVDLTDCWGKTALWWSCYYGRIKVSGLLAHAGADPTIADHEGRYPLTIVTETQHESCRTLLEEWERAYVLTKARRLRDAYTSIATNDGSTPITADERRRLEGELAGVELGECLRGRVCWGDTYTHKLPCVQLVKGTLPLDVDCVEFEGHVHGNDAAEKREDVGEDDSSHDHSTPTHDNCLCPHHHGLVIDVNHHYEATHVCNDGGDDRLSSSNDDGTVVGFYQGYHGSHDAMAHGDMTPAGFTNSSFHHHGFGTHDGFEDGDSSIIGAGVCHDYEWRVWAGMVADHVLESLKGELFAYVMALIVDD